MLKGSTDRQAASSKERSRHLSGTAPQELEKFKFVLDYKIKELKKQIEPREMQITNMKDQIKVGPLSAG